jgi:hypothetical protein
MSTETTSTTTTTNDTSAIDAKKNVNNTDQQINTTKIQQYLQSILPSIFTAVIYFTLGSIVLYGFKISQANVLPTDINYWPYTEKIPNIEKVVSNIYGTSTEPQYSQKLFFKYTDNNTGNTILDFTRSIKENTNSGAISLFFVNIFQNLIRVNYSSLNEIFNAFNEFEFNDFYIVLFGPILLIMFIIVFLMFVNPIYFIYLWFTNLGLFLKKVQNKGENGTAQWKDIEMDRDPINYWFGIGMIIFFFFLFFFLFGFLGLFTSVVSIFVVIFSIIRYKCVLNFKENVGLGTIIKNNLKYYKEILAILITIPLVTNANSILGPIPAVLTILAIILMFTNLIPINLYESNELDKLSKSIPLKIARWLPYNPTSTSGGMPTK